MVTFRHKILNPFLIAKGKYGGGDWKKNGDEALVFDPTPKFLEKAFGRGCIISLKTSNTFKYEINSWQIKNETQ